MAECSSCRPTGCALCGMRNGVGMAGCPLPNCRGTPCPNTPDYEAATPPGSPTLA
jgi:hypothetical protein